MAVKQLYVSKAFETFWARAEVKAKKRGVSFAEYVSRLIRNDILLDGRDLTLDEALDELRSAIETVARLTRSEVTDDIA